jgi:hypothetical protein
MEADFNDRYIHQDTPINTAILNRDNKLLLRLLHEGIYDINTANNHGNTALHIAIMHDNQEAFRLLLYHGASLGRLNNEGHNALATALITQNVPIVIFLVDYLVGTSISTDQDNFSYTVNAYEALHRCNEPMMALWHEFLENIRYNPLTTNDPNVSSSSTVISHSNDSTYDEEVRDTSFSGVMFHNYDHHSHI